MARHLTAEMLLGADVNNLPNARRQLGHTQPETTEKLCGMARTSAAQSVYAELVDQDRAGIVAKERQTRRRKP